jgi:hypothetical protein
MNNQTNVGSWAQYSLGGVPIITYGMIGLTTLILAAATIYDHQAPADNSEGPSSLIPSILSPTAITGSTGNEADKETEESGAEDKGILSTIGLGQASEKDTEKASESEEESAPKNETFMGTAPTEPEPNDSFFPEKPATESEAIESQQNDSIFPQAEAEPVPIPVAKAIGGKNKRTKRNRGGKSKSKSKSTRARKQTKRSKN